jgi:hypothetical protein
MKSSPIPLLGLALILISGCCSMKPKTASTPPPPPAVHKRCPAEFPFHYVDSAHGFSLCLPKHLTKTDASSYPAGSVMFTGFSVPAGTNLQSKKLIIVSGTDSNLQAATGWGHLTADGVTFKRMTAGDGSAGHMTTYLSYTWTEPSQVLHFDFQLYAVNPMVYPPATRPEEYNLGAQRAYANEVMDTFRKLH